MQLPRRLPADFGHSAAYPLFAFDSVQDRAWVLHFAADDYRRASFLDQRALDHRDISGWEVTRAEIEAATSQPQTASPVHWLFHIGHCGSTLVSRLLDLIPGVLGLREPLPLLALVQGGAGSAWFEPTLRLLGRGFPDTLAIVVKPTSVVSTLAAPLLATQPGQACLLWVDLRTWLATILRDADLRDTTLSTESLRLTHSIGVTMPMASTDAERVARLWLLEQLRWRQLARTSNLGSRLLDIDFAAVLADPAAVTARLALHYGLMAPVDWRQRIADSQLLARYAKDERQAFDADTRRRELQAAHAMHRDEIDAALNWSGRALAALAEPLLVERLRPTR